MQRFSAQKIIGQVDKGALESIENYHWLIDRNLVKVIARASHLDLDPVAGEIAFRHFYDFGFNDLFISIDPFYSADEHQLREIIDVSDRDIDPNHCPTIWGA